MDWKQFVASIIDALAWPTVLVVFLIICRTQVRQLASRVEELNILGTKAKFREELAAGREVSARLPHLQALPPLQFTIEEVADQSPDDAIVLVYNELERILVEIRDELQLGSLNMPSTIKQLVKRKLVTSDVSEAFNRLRNAKNEIEHYVSDLIPPEAREFVDQALVLRDNLGAVLQNIKSPA